MSASLMAWLREPKTLGLTDKPRPAREVEEVKVVLMARGSDSLADLGLPFMFATAGSEHPNTECGIVPCVWIR